MANPTLLEQYTDVITVEGDKKAQCTQCQKIFEYKTQKLVYHKRGKNCIGQTKEEHQKFMDLNTKTVYVEDASSIVSKRSRTSIATSKQTKIDRWHDSVKDGDVDRITAVVARFFYRTAIPFHIADSRAFKEMIRLLRPAYSTLMPSGKVLATTRLNAEHERIQDLLNARRDGQAFRSLVTDGWTNTRSEHLVNFVLVSPGERPLYLESVPSGAERQTADAIATLIKRVLRENGGEKIVSLVTDNASVMRAAWAVVKVEFPRIYNNGCAAHLTDLLVRELCDEAGRKATLEKATYVTKFIKSHSLLRHAFNQVRRERATKDLVLPVPTRWYTHYRCLDSLLANRRCIGDLINSPGGVGAHFHTEAKKEQARDFERQVDAAFWEAVTELHALIKQPTEMVGVFEADTTLISAIPREFAKLAVKHAGNPFVLAVVAKRAKQTITPCMRFAALLDPNNIGRGNPPPLQDIVEFTTHVQEVWRHEEHSGDFNRQLDRFIAQSSVDAKVLHHLQTTNPLYYWDGPGCGEFPALYPHAKRLFSIPTSSAASERAWSVLGAIHTKRRNRLGNDKVNKLAFIYINAALLDAEDPTDYGSKTMDDSCALMEVEEEGDAVIVMDEQSDAGSNVGREEDFEDLSGDELLRGMNDSEDHATLLPDPSLVNINPDSDVQEAVPLNFAFESPGEWATTTSAWRDVCVPAFRLDYDGHEAAKTSATPPVPPPSSDADLLAALRLLHGHEWCDAFLIDTVMRLLPPLHDHRMGLHREGLGFLEDPARVDRRPFLQVCHRPNHWYLMQVRPGLMGDPTEVTVFDSLSPDPLNMPAPDLRALDTSLGGLGGPYRFQYAPACQQRDTYSCGVLAIAFAVEIALRGDPSRVFACGDCLRLHLTSCLYGLSLSVFPGPCMH
jgi:hypothetical protein